MPRILAACSTFFFDFVLGDFAKFEAKSHIVEYRHMGVERVALENHRDIAIFRSHVIDDLIGDQDIALGHFFEPCEASQSRGLATT